MLIYDRGDGQRFEVVARTDRDFKPLPTWRLLLAALCLHGLAKLKARLTLIPLIEPPEHINCRCYINFNDKTGQA